MTLSSPTSSATNDSNTRKQLIYLVRHAEATHNIREREAIQAVIRQGIHEACEHDKARRAVLQDASLLDAPLSPDGQCQVMRASCRLNQLDPIKYPPPKIVLVSPLRRVLMTATELFGNRSNGSFFQDSPRFVALEALREKRTGFAADERLPVDLLEKEFPHVDFSDLRPGNNNAIVVLKGEDNDKVRKRATRFLDEYLPTVEEDSIAIVSHKAWLRELRKTLKDRLDEKQLEVDFDVQQWHQTLFGNAEIRVADFRWTGQKLRNIVSRSVENALEGLVGGPILPIPLQDQSKNEPREEEGFLEKRSHVTSKPGTDVSLGKQVGLLYKFIQRSNC